MTLPIPPGLVTADNREHFEALESGRLLVPRCQACGEAFWYPRHSCPFCGSLEVGWLEASGRGRVYSFSIVRRGQGAYAEAAPYVLAYVQLEEGPRVMTNLLSDDLARLRVGQVVEMVIEKAEGVPPLLRFRVSG